MAGYIAHDSRDDVEVERDRLREQNAKLRGALEPIAALAKFEHPTSAYSKANLVHRLQVIGSEAQTALAEEVPA